LAGDGDAAAAAAAVSVFHSFSPRHADAAPAAVYIFPHAGSTAAHYYPLAERLAEFYPCHVMQYAGRAERRDDPGPATMADLVDEALAGIGPGPGPVILAGHSAGATVAFEVARRLGERVALVVLSGRVAPDADQPDLPTQVGADLLLGLVEQDLGDQAADRLAALGEDGLELIRQAMERDTRLMAGFTPDPAAVVDAPLLILSGDQDDFAPAAAAAGWARHTTGASRQVTFPGGHLFIDSHWTDIARQIIAAATSLEATS